MCLALRLDLKGLNPSQSQTCTNLHRKSKIWDFLRIMAPLIEIRADLSKLRVKLEYDK
jgi:hypothetical protein